MEKALIALSAALCVAITGLATAWAQSRVGGAGAVAEKPEVGGTIIILMAIPETMVILGFVVAIMIILGI